MIKKIFIIIFVFLSATAFFKINEKNYIKHNEIKNTFVEHPENIQTKESALITSFGFRNLLADMYRLKAVQYIGSNAFSVEYKKFLYIILDLVTELNPYFEHPYIIGQLLLPTYEPRYESITELEQKTHTIQAKELSLKGINNFCDLNKIELIDSQDDLYKIWNEDIYKNPCLSYKVPYYLAYIYYYYLNDPINAAKYYKIASAIDSSPEGVKIMAAIMQGKGGNREKAFFMFLTLSKYVEPDNQLCNTYSEQLESLGVGVFLNKQINLDGDLLIKIEETRKSYFDGIDTDSLLEDTKCSNYINKSVRELNLYYIEENNKRYFADTGKNSYNAKNLYDEGYIDYLPIDFQQYDDSDYGIIYIFNENTGNYDYDMSRY